MDGSVSPQPRPTSSSPVRSRERPFTVGEVLRQVRDCLEDNFLPLLVRGEVADLRRPRGGNIYFSLRDARARLRVVAFASTLRRVPHTLENGADALVWGRISAYPPSGDVQLIAEHFEPAGLGARHQELERLRKRLAAEGLFAAERKRPLPWVPRSVGVVTSPTGSAIHDVRTTLARRFPGLRVVLSPSRVNGAECAPQLVRALRALDERGGVDVILVVRGGGSREDLAGFDDEAVVRAVAACRTPVVSGVGHEDDVTLIDLVADRRAPTPTGAAELAVPVREELLAELDRRGRRMRVAVNRRLEDAR
ncbi:MAG: exodeoxyribonuclease VII large subunit, partial [Planctomycetota bacterium]